jgi:hypothetical protein
MGRLVCFTIISFHLENRGCLSRGVQVTGMAWQAATRIMTGVGDLVQRIGDGRTSPYSVERIVHIEMRSAGFLIEPQNQGRWFVSGLTSKSLGQLSLIWPQNRWRRFFRFDLKTGGSGLLI